MENKIKKEAAEFRNRLGYGNFDPIRLKSLLIKLNIITAFKALSDNFSGMAVKSGEFRFVLINSNHSIGRQHFTICHELYHLYIDKNFKPHHCHTGCFDKKNINEYFADIFASYFLMPEDGILDLIPDNQLKKDKISVTTLLKIEHFFSCSRSALLFRLKDLNFISNNYFELHSKNVKLIAKEYGYSVDLYKKGNKNVIIGDYGVNARNLYDDEKISEGHYVSLMNDIGIDILNKDLNGD